MSKKLYYSILTLAFGIISIPTVLNIIFQERILSGVINTSLLKVMLIFFICIVEVQYMKRKFAKTIGSILCIGLLIGVFFKILHWPYGSELIMFSGFSILILLTIVASIEKNKELLQYLLFLFVLQRLIIILLLPIHQFLWWFDIGICLAITLLGILKLLNIKILKR